MQLRCNTTGGNISGSETNKATRLLVATVIVFLVCQVPSALLLIYEAIFPLEYSESKVTRDIILGLNNIANGLTAINASINFILYSCFSKRFRDTLKQIFSFKKKTKSSMPFDVSTTSQTNHRRVNNTNSSKRNSNAFINCA